MSSDRSSGSLPSSQSFTSPSPKLRRVTGNRSTNPFLNFLASLRPKRNITTRAAVGRARGLWRQMSAEQRLQYHATARRLARRSNKGAHDASRAQHRSPPPRPRRRLVVARRQGGGGGRSSRRGRRSSRRSKRRRQSNRSGRGGTSRRRRNIETARRNRRIRPHRRERHPTIRIHRKE